MTRNKKILLILTGLLIVAAFIGFRIRASRQTATVVETGTVRRADYLVAKVSATGEIKPREYVELQAEIAGVVTEVLIREGDSVRKGDVLLRIDPVQTEAETRAQEALLEASLAEARSQKAQISLQKTSIERDRADVRMAEAEVYRARQTLELAEASFNRTQQLFEDNLVSKDIYDAARNELVIAETSLQTAEARLEQARAQLRVSEVVLSQARTAYEAANSRVAQQKANLDRTLNILSKTVIQSPLSGVITQLNVEVGERAVPGTLNSPAATLMIIADLSIIEAELRVDEADIVDVELGQEAEVLVDALPNRPLFGYVTEIGSSPISTTAAGVTTQQQEAKEFKVVIQLKEPPPVLRPGLSCTAEITTATRNDVLTVPIQALTIREFPIDEMGQLIRTPKDAAKKDSKEETLHQETKEFEGVFKVVNNKAVFTPVETGIIGDTDIEIISGLEAGDVIVTGSFQTLRTLNDGDAIKVEGRSGRG
ncbi:MAG TPA: efflux RND transporter periplasmic adaptor subunit [Acidobacteriota bacterium]|nr:efflux RND transporter periplasmic adaptor subunit [Acidobacteriota bacterium]